MKNRLLLVLLALAVVILGLFMFGRGPIGDRDEPGQPAPHALDQS